MAKQSLTIWLVRDWNQKKSEWFIDKSLGCEDKTEMIEAHVDCFGGVRSKIIVDEYFLVPINSPMGRAICKHPPAVRRKVLSIGRAPDAP